MITPVFQINQDSEFVHLSINCPYIKASQVQIDISGTEFRFYANPYFLKLNFPKSLVEDGRETSSYDVASGKVLLKIPKEEKGEFKDLDFITKLLDVKAQNGGQGMPMIQVLDNEETNAGNIDFEENLGTAVISTDGKHGFNNQYRDASIILNSICMEIIEINDLEVSNAESRNEFRCLMEDAKFDPEYYCHDYKNLQEIQSLLDFKPKTWKILQKLQKGEFVQDFSEKELEMMKNLPNKECKFEFN